MLNPRYQSSLSKPPRAICAMVVPKPSEKLIWNECPPARISMREAAVGDARVVAEPRRHFGDEVQLRPDAEPAAETDDERVVVVAGHEIERSSCCRSRSAATYTAPCASELPRDDGADRGRVDLLEVVPAFDGHDDVDADRQRLRSAGTTAAARRTESSCRSCGGRRPACRSGSRSDTRGRSAPPPSVPKPSASRSPKLPCAERTREAVRHAERAARTSACAASSEAR